MSESGSDSEQPIIMRWVSNGNQMLKRALSHKDNQNKNKSRFSYTEQSTPCDPRIAKLKEKLREREKLLCQLEKQENDFLGVDNQIKDTTIFRIDFEAVTCKDYYLVPGCPETFIPCGTSITVFGQLRNNRWRCVVKNDSCLNTKKSDVFLRENSDIKNTSDEFCEISQGKYNKQLSYPLIGSIPSSIIAELNEGNNVNVDKMNDETTSEAEESSTDTEDDADTKHTNSFLCKCGRHLPRSRNSLSRLKSCSFCQYCAIPTISSSVQTTTAEHSVQLNFQRFSFIGLSSVPLPTLPESPTETTIAELNMALENLAKIAPRNTRPFSGGSDGSCNSWTSDF